MVRQGNSHVYAQYTVEVNNRLQVQETLQNKGIPTAVHYPVPLHRQPAFDFLNQDEGSFPVAEAASKMAMSLPMHPYHGEPDQDQVVSALRSTI